jgi:hypothetical protein
VHQLRESWQIQDSTVEAERAAQAAQTYHRLTGDNTRRIAADIAAIDDEIHILKREQRRQATEIQELRNTCLFWGALSAIVCSFAMSLLFQPAPPAQPYQPQYQQVLP